MRSDETCEFTTGDGPEIHTSYEEINDGDRFLSFLHTYQNSYKISDSQILTIEKVGWANSAMLGGGYYTSGNGIETNITTYPDGSATSSTRSMPSVIYTPDFDSFTGTVEGDGNGEKMSKYDSHNGKSLDVEMINPVDRDALRSEANGTKLSR